MYTFFSTIASEIKLFVRKSSGVGIEVELAPPPAALTFSTTALYLFIAASAFLPLFFFLYDLAAYPLRDTNEGLYAEIAREMLETGNFVIPTLLGVPYIEKPPLLYWLMALSFHVFGISETSARLVSALPMAGLSFGIFVFCRTLGNARAGFYALLILSTALPVVVLSRTVMFDPLLTALLAAVFLAFFKWHVGKSKAWLRVSALFLALATLEKGGVSLILAGGVIVTFLLMMRDLRTLRAMADPVAISLFLVIAAPWHVLASLQQDGFAWFYFINEHCLRFFGMREPRDYHTGPFYYYLSRLLMLLLPWTPFLGLLIDFPNKQDRAKQTLIRFCQAWVLFPLLFFSLSVAKSEYYLVLIAPAGALWLGLALEHHLQKEDDGMLSHCMGLALALCTAAFLALLFASPSQWLSLENMPLWWPICCVAAWALGARLIVVSRGRGWMRDAALASLGLAMIPILILVLRTADAKSERTSSRHIGELISGQGNVKPAVFVYRNFEDAFSSLPFFLRNTVKVIDSQSRDLQFGCRVAPGDGSACISSLQFSQYLKNRPVAVAVLDQHIQSFHAEFGGYPWRSERRGDKWIFFNY